ncbi:MAG: hypothetical protein LBF50_00675 [Azoarcus sp.]|jgi:hypothetical protein|nr:hypothetical protein [Azoarcus sp.]
MRNWLDTILLSAALLAPPVLAADKDNISILLPPSCSDYQELCHQYDYQDLWWDPAQSGMGVNIDQQGDTLVATWYHYDDNGNPVWLQASGKMTTGGSSIMCAHADISCITTIYLGVYDVPLYRTTGPTPGPNYSATDVKATPVGTASISFIGANFGSLHYTYDNKIVGLLDLQRYTYNPPSLAGKWRFISIITDANGDTSYQSGSAIFSDPIVDDYYHNYTITGDLATNSAIDFQTLSLHPAGSIFGDVSCKTGEARRWCEVFEVRIIGDTFLLKGVVSSNQTIIPASGIRIMGVRAPD